VAADRSPGNAPPATFGGNGVVVLPEFSLTVRDLPDLDTHIVELSGELDVASADFLTNALTEVAGPSVVVDLSGLDFMDSSGVGALVVARNRIKAKGRGDLVLTRPGAIVQKVLEIVGLSAWVADWSPNWATELSERGHTSRMLEVGTPKF
jgi:anti-sigma B factor antagonist